ncbi:MAG: DUF4384 domain-containing protein [Bacteroidota bacterium]
MRIAFLSLSLSMLLSGFIAAETPEWVKNLGKSVRYPEQLYITGFGMAKLDKEENQAQCLQLAVDRARKTLIEKIRVRVQSVASSETKEINEKIGSYYTNVIQTSSNLELDGLQTESYYDDDDGIAYGFTFINREQVTDANREKTKNLRKEIQGHLANGRRFEDAKQRTQALNEFLACYPLLRKIEEAMAIISASESNVAKAFAELEDSTATDVVSSIEVQQAVTRLIQRPVDTIDEIAWCIAYMLKNQTGIPGKTVMVVPFTYQDTRLGSPFSRYFKQSLEDQLIELAQWSIVQQTAEFQPKTRDVGREYAQASGAEYVLSGTYWEMPNEVKFQAIVRQVSDARIIASTEHIAPTSVIQASNLSIKPQNFKEAFADQKEFNTGEVIDGGLNLEVWTNKGAENLIFTNGERLTVSLRVNMPCYVRFIYHLANGKRALLLNNHYIDETKVNKVYEIPQEFECFPPFGAEFLQVFARTEPFEKVETVQQDDYEILKEDLSDILATTRGLKKVNPKVLQVETRITITTMEK